MPGTGEEAPASLEPAEDDAPQPDLTVVFEKLRTSLTSDDISNLRSALNSVRAFSGRAMVKDEPMDYEEAATNGATDDQSQSNQNENSENTDPAGPSSSDAQETPLPVPVSSIKSEPLDEVTNVPDQSGPPLADVKPIKTEVDNDVKHLWSSITGLLRDRSSEIDQAIQILSNSDLLSRLASRDSKDNVRADSEAANGPDAVSENDTDRSRPVFPPVYSAACHAPRARSPVYFTSIGPTEPPKPPDISRQRRNGFADPVGPCLYDLFMESKRDSGPVWPGEIVIPHDVRQAKERENEARRQKEAEAAKESKKEIAKHVGTAHIPSIFLDRVRSDIAVDLAPPTLQESVAAVRRLMRKRMHRCRYCGNRFVETDIFERHITEKHPDKLEKYRSHKSRKEEKERIRYLQFKSKMKEIEDKRNQRLADQYEKTIEINRKREVLGLAPLEMEELFPPRPKRPRIFRDPSPDNDDNPNASDPSDPDRVIKFKKRICPQCPFCDKRYKNDSFLRKHIARKHPECIHYVQCNKCYKAVINAEALKNHHCDLTWVCLECKPIRNMVTAERLMNHKNKFHRGEASGFKCLECERKFLTPRKLKTHKKLAHIHTRTYKCHFCDEHFIAEYQVSLHERIHTGKVKFECPICDFKCARWVTLSEHKKDDHGYLCMICGERVMEWPELKRHTLDEHEGYLSVDSQTGAFNKFE